MSEHDHIPLQGGKDNSLEGLLWEALIHGNTIADRDSTLIEETSYIEGLVERFNPVSEVQLQTIREQVLDACVKEMIARHAPLSLCDIPTMLADQVLTIVKAVLEGKD